MNRTIELLRLIVICRQIDGRKKLQKIVYILKEYGYPFDFRYGFHFHGPFSDELKSEIDVLVGQQLLGEEESQSFSGTFRQYGYSATPALRTLLDHIKAREEPVWGERAKKLNALSAQELESISTMVYLIRHGTSTSDLANRFKDLKPHLVQYSNSASKAAIEITGKTQAPHSPA